MAEKMLLKEIGKMIAPIAERQMHMQTMMEHMDKKINALAEGQANMNDKFAKLDQVAEDVEEIKAKVTALEAVTKDNTSQIRELKIAK